MIVDVALPIPVAKTFSYYVPPLWRSHLKLLSRVIVPFRTRVLAGFVTAFRDGEKGALKEIEEPADLFPLADGVLGELADWASRYYVTPPGLVLKYVLPPFKDVQKYLIVDMDERKGIPLKKAISSMGKKRVMEGVRDGTLTIRDLFTNEPFLPGEPKTPPSKAEGTLFIGGADERLFHYISLISACMEKNENVLMLLPDYHGTGDYFSRAFNEAFPGKVLWYGTSMKGKERMETYFRSRKSGGFLILGNRSSVFLPVLDLGLVIVERHEEDYYRNEEDFRFNAARIAMERAALEGVPVVLGSVSPSVDFFKEAEVGRLRTTQGEWPPSIPFSEVLMEKNIASYDGLPEGLVDVMGPMVEHGGKIALYTPRKDYSSSIRCADCKTLFTCPSCGGILAYQKSTDRLVCPSCGGKFPYEEKCPQCGSSLIRFFRVGAEYFEERVKLLFPEILVSRITGDTSKKERAQARKKADQSPFIFIGTQTLSTFYGMNVDMLILAGWEDLARTSGYKAREKMFQVLMHLLDALNPRELVFCMEQKKRIDPALFLDTIGFLKDETARRKTAEFPPYTRFFLVEISKKEESAGIKAIARVREVLDAHGYRGDVTGPLFQKRQQYQWRMILTGDGDELYRSLLGLYAIPDVHIEADPPYL